MRIKGRPVNELLVNIKNGGFVRTLINPEDKAAFFFASQSDMRAKFCKNGIKAVRWNPDQALERYSAYWPSTHVSPPQTCSKKSGSA